MNTCATCRHSAPRITDDCDIMLECRRYPPAVSADPNGILLSAFVQVEEGDWCGEWAEVHAEPRPRILPPRGPRGPDPFSDHIRG
jgi:hypothetical protein